MSNYIFKPTEEKIEFGDTISFLFTEEIAAQFEKMGIIKKVKERPVPVIHDNLSWYIDKLKKRIGLDGKEKVFDVLLKAINTGIIPYSFLALLKEIALELDQKYEGHISDCKTVYTISLTDGKIYEQDATRIKCFRFISAFRTKEDAEFALKILKPLINEMFNNEQKSKKYLS